MIKLQGGFLGNTQKQTLNEICKNDCCKAAIQAVIELLGPEFYVDEFWKEFYPAFKSTQLTKDAVPSAIDGASFQHEQMINKLRGES